MEKQPTQHLSYFKVRNFKGLDQFELNEIGQFNLILGDNNIGKTSVLESLLFNENPFFHFGSLYYSYMIKNMIQEYLGDTIDYVSPFIKNDKDEILYYYKRVDLSDETKLLSTCVTKGSLLSDDDRFRFSNNSRLSVNKIPDKVVQYSTPKEVLFFPLNLEDYQERQLTLDFPYIPTSVTYNSDLVDYFSKTVNLNLLLKRELIVNLKLMQNDIEDVIIDTTTIPDHPVLMVVFSDGNHFPLYMLGDGTVRLFRFILEVILCAGKRLMIDEIDNGMHFSKMKKVWEVVLKVAEKHNTQLFITTHNAECLRAFKEVLEEQEMKHLQEKVASYSLFRNKEGKVDNVRYSFEGFEFALDNNIEVRD